VFFAQPTFRSHLVRGPGIERAPGRGRCERGV